MIHSSPACLRKGIPAPWVTASLALTRVLQLHLVGCFCYIQSLINHSIPPIKIAITSDDFYFLFLLHSGSGRVWLWRSRFQFYWEAEWRKHCVVFKVNCFTFGSCIWGILKFEQDMVLMNIIIATVVICMDFSMLILLKLKFKRDFDNEYSLCPII